MQKKSERKVVYRVISIIMICLMVFIQVPIAEVQAAGEPGQAADEFDTLRIKWREMLTGGTSYDLSDPKIAAAINRTTATAQSNWDSMDKSVGRTYLWSDLSSTTISAQVTSAYTRLRSMATAYCTYGSSLQNDSALLADIISAMDWMYTNRYNENKSKYDNWWDWNIGAALPVNDITVLLYDTLTQSQVTNYMNAVDKFAPTPSMTAANRVWLSTVVGVRGVIVKDGAKIAAARDGLSDTLTLVTKGDGFYADGSFIQHNRFAYTGGYGIGYMGNIGNLMYLLSDSTYEVTDPNKQNVFKWVYDAFEPLIYKGAMMDMVRGRELSRSYKNDRITANEAIRAIIRLSQFASSQDAAAYKAMVKYWLESDPDSFYIDASVEMTAIANEILRDSNVASRGEVIRYKQYPSMDRVVHLRPGFGFGISMFSSRIYNFENANSENQRGWHTGDGMTYLYNSDLSQFSDAFWPTVNSYRLPGTTVLQNSQQTAVKNSTMNWVGGTDILGTYGVTGMNLQPYQKNLTAKKSWFMFDDEIVALGSDIDSADGIPVETVVENRMLNSSGNNALTVNGQAKSSVLGWSESMPGTDWIHLAGNNSDSDIGYYFPDKAKVDGVREARTGAFSDIDKRAGASTTEYTRNYLNLWLDHGINPANAGYSYVLLPNKTSSQVGSYAQNPDIEILRNDEEVQAVKEKELNIIGANFWNDTPATAGIITSNKKAAVMTKEETGKSMEVSVSDPTQANPGYINITINRNAKGIISCDDGITVTQLSPTIKLLVDVNGAHGKAFKVKFDYTGLSETPYEPEIDGDRSVTLFTDDFEGGDTSAWSTNGGVWGIENDTAANTTALRVTGASESIAAAGSAWTDYTLKGKVKVLEEGGNAGLVFRYIDNENYYTMCLNASTNQIELYKKVENTLTLAAHSDFTVNASTWYTLKVTVNGNNITGFVNGNPAIDWTNPSNELTSGKIGFRAMSVASFDEAAVTTNNLVDETFNSIETTSTPSDWELKIDSDVVSKGGGITVEEFPDVGNKSLKLNDTSNTSSDTGTVYATKKFEPYSGTVTAELKVLASQVNAILGVSLNNSAGNSIATVAFGNNTDGKPNLAAYDGGTKKTFQIPTSSGPVNYTANTWYRLKFVANSTTLKYDLYMDAGNGEGYKAVATNFGFRNTSSPYVGSVYFNTTNPQKGVFYIDDIKVTPNDSGIITTSPDTFYKDAQKDVKVYLNLHGNTVSSITNGGYALTESDYTMVSSSVYAINSSYLSTLQSGTATLTFKFSAGNDASTDITIVETAPKNSEIASISPDGIDKKVPEDVTVNLNPNGNTVTFITNGRYTLTNSDYTIVNDSEIKIKAEYLDTLSNGTATLTFHFSAGNDSEVRITITSTAIVSIEPVSAATTAGTPPVLPATVTAIRGDNTTTTAAVQWAEIAPSQYEYNGSFSVTGTVEGTAIPATATVTVTGGTDPEPAIVSIQPVSVSTTEGTAPVLPATVILVYSDNSTTSAAVQWAEIAPEQYAQTGSFNVTGTVEGTAIEATATVTVTSAGTEPEEPTIASIQPVSVTTIAGTAPVLPATVTVIYSDDTTTSAAVQWAEIAPEQYAQTGSFIVTGTVEGTAIEATATVTVTSAGTEPEEPTIVSIQPVSVTTTAGTAPVLPAAVTVTYSDDITTSAAVQWAAISPSQYAQAGSFNVTGTVEGTAIEATATVTVNAAPVTPPVTPPSSVPSVVVPVPDPVVIDNETVKVEAKADKDGKVTVSIKGEHINSAVNNSKDGTVSIEVKADEKTKEVKVNIPIQQIVAADKHINNIKVDTGLATATINPELLKNSNISETADLQLIVTKVDSTAIPSAAGGELDDSEVYDFSLYVNGTNVSSFKNKEISVDLYYELKAGQDSNKVIVYYISDSGKLEIVKNSWYDAATGKVRFKPEHFSKYAAAYNDITFSDLSKAAWAKSSIEALAARGIVAGRGDNLFMPDSSITRAEFLTMLMNAFELTDDSADCTFKDASSGKWYYNAVATAQKLGIVQGKPDGTFGINDAITRQDMAVMVYKVSELLRVKMEETNSPVQFKDSSNISAYAAEAISAMQKAGIINGVGKDNFAPKNNATRAQAAVIINQVFNLAK